MPLISVIIPAYNAEKTIERTVRSVQASTIPLEIWIVDDGSTDGTGALADRLAANNPTIQQSNNQTILHVIHQPNSGAYQARLNALKQIETPYFGFVDADDTVEPEMYEKMLEFAKREQLDVVQVKWNTERPVGNPNPSRIPQSNNPKSNNPKSNNLKSNNQTILSGLTDIFNAIVRPIMWEGRDSSFIWDKLYRNQYDFSTFDPTDHVTNFDDLIFNLQFFTKVERMGFIDEPLYHYNATIGSAARKFRWKIVKDFRETFRIRRKLAPAYGVRPWGWMNFRWFVKNARNLLVIWLKSKI